MSRGTGVSEGRGAVNCPGLCIGDLGDLPDKGFSALAKGCIDLVVRASSALVVAPLVRVEAAAAVRHLSRDFAIAFGNAGFEVDRAAANGLESRWVASTGTALRACAACARATAEA